MELLLPSSFTCLAISPSLMASDLPYMLTTSILDSSIFTFTYPSKYLPECLLSIWNNIFSKTNSWFLTNPQLHPAILSSILQTSSYQSLSSWVAQNNIPFTHSALPTKSSLMFFKQTKEHPHIKASVLTDVSTWDALCPEIHMTHLLPSVSAQMLLFFNVKLSKISSYPALFFFRTPVSSNTYLLSFSPNETVSSIRLNILFSAWYTVGTQILVEWMSKP